MKLESFLLNERGLSERFVENFWIVTLTENSLIRWLKKEEQGGYFEDIQIPEVAQGNMEEDLCSISSVDDGFQVAQKKKEEYKNELKEIFTRTLNRRDPWYLLISKQIDLIKVIIKERIEIEQAEYFNNKLVKIRPGPTGLQSSVMRDVSVNGVKVVELDQKLDVLREHFASIFHGTSPGSDTTDIQDAINNTISLASNIFSNCLNNSYFPYAWKRAKFIPTQKQKDNVDVNNFKPISLLSNIGKLLERVIREKMDIECMFRIFLKNSLVLKRELYGTCTLKFQSDIVQGLREQKVRWRCR
ncbi:RNA-directed DNA polymerase from mobile element jockey [Eumeta japonica]|uniref:RNA-directed DNA polymerase from mobile element jockey n=1 Tax=Eumeta variegata TaxID=151549 RepID=A0A4C1SCC5_EUMVA|nr:RNA-directed DNA polymerase from mobile element jockey [Eumeta japonica]